MSKKDTKKVAKAAPTPDLVLTFVLPEDHAVEKTGKVIATRGTYSVLQNVTYQHTGDLADAIAAAVTALALLEGNPPQIPTDLKEVAKTEAPKVESKPTWSKARHDELQAKAVAQDDGTYIWTDAPKDAATTYAAEIADVTIENAESETPTIKFTLVEAPAPAAPVASGKATQQTTVQKEAPVQAALL